MKFKKYIIFLFLYIVIFNCYTGEAKYKKYINNYYAMGTDLTVIFFTDDKKKAEDILLNCEKLANELEKKVSCKMPASIISQLNSSKRKIIEDDFVLNLILQSLKLSKITNNAFDPALYNLTSLWGFDSGNREVPDKIRIADALAKSGADNVIINAREVILKNEAALDLGGIAKGKIIDEIADYLKSMGLIDYLINGGGDIVAKGFYNNKRKWKIAIADPFIKSKYLGYIDLSDYSIVTSGDYERFFYKNGKLYHHILDPKTGYPVDSGLHSVTVIADDTAKADALATALFVLGKDIGLAFANKYKDIGVIFVYGDKDNKDIYVSDNIIMTENDDGTYNFKYK